MIVSTAMISVYSNQNVREEITIAEFSDSLQDEILSDVALESDFRLAALAVEEDVPGDSNYDVLDSFVRARVPEGFGYLLRVCKLGDERDFCKMDARTFVASMEKDVFVEDVVIGAELGNGTDASYSPKKVRLFFWEGGFPDNYCRDECSEEGVSYTCSMDFRNVTTRTCGNTDTSDECLEYGPAVFNRSCGAGEICVDGGCVVSPYSELTCYKKKITKTGGGVKYDDECSGYDGGRSWDCGFWKDDCDYECWDNVYETTACSLIPSCSPGFTPQSASPCVPACSGTCSAGDSDVLSCSADLVMNRSCEDVDLDGCYDWSSPALSENCSLSGKICSGGACVEAGCSDSRNDMGVCSSSGIECGSAVDTCGADRVCGVCSGTDVCTLGMCVATEAVLKAIGVLDSTSVGGGDTYYYYTSTISSMNEVGVTINSRQKCFLIDSCDPVKTTISEFYGTNYIPAGGSISNPTNYWFTSFSSEVMTETFYGVDDNGNYVSISYTMSA